MTTPEEIRILRKRLLDLDKEAQHLWSSYICGIEGSPETELVTQARATRYQRNRDEAFMITEALRKKGVK